MKMTTIAVAVAAACACMTAAVVAQDPVLWYEQPAAKWEEALPVGNGRLGAMVFGSQPVERLQLNEESLWAGEPCDAYPDDFRKHLTELQNLVLAGKIEAARQLGIKKLTKSPTSYRSYEPLVDLWIESPATRSASDYRRDLNLATGIATVTYQSGDTRFTQEAGPKALLPKVPLSQKLECDRPLESGVLCLVDDTHSAGAEFPKVLVAREHVVH